MTRSCSVFGENLKEQIENFNGTKRVQMSKHHLELKSSKGENSNEYASAGKPKGWVETKGIWKRQQHQKLNFWFARNFLTMTTAAKLPLQGKLFCLFVVCDDEAVQGW